MNDNTLSGSVSNKGIIQSSSIPMTGGIDQQICNEADDVGHSSMVSQRYTPQLYPGGAHIKGLLLFNYIFK